MEYISLVGTVITALVTLVGVFMSAKNTQDKVTHQLETSQAVTENEMKHINEEIAEMKTHIKEHNGYGKLFAENIPVIHEQLKVVNHRLSDLEHKS